MLERQLKLLLLRLPGASELPQPQARTVTHQGVVPFLLDLVEIAEFRLQLVILLLLLEQLFLEMRLHGASEALCMSRTAMN